jgi:lipopolysaccharide transport system permease protein
LFTGAPVTWRYIFIFIPILELYAFCLGIGLFLAQAYVFFRDIEYIWNVITTAWLYLSAIFYPVDSLPRKIHFLVTNFNPMYLYITMFRNFTIGSPNIGSLNLAIHGAVFSLLALLAGFISFSYSKKKFILYM